MLQHLITRALLAATLFGAWSAGPVAAAAPGGNPFAKDNLVAWCIVPFDARQRGPVERAAMLQRLGIGKLAYDWRQKDIPTFAQEIDALKAHGIELAAFWCPCGLQPEKQEILKTILNLLERKQVRTQLWVTLDVRPVADLDQAGKVAAAARAIGYIAGEAAKIGCSVGLYNHGGWFGQPANQIAIIKRLGLDNVGIVYNFHHGHADVDRFADLFTKMQPYLLAVNLNGMKLGGPMILPIGAGDREKGMLEVIRRSDYHGLVGILDHRSELDAEESLRQNLDGLRNVLQ